MLDLYPFRGRYTSIGGFRYHYVDEGEGPPMVMILGNPTWSFYYRNLVREFSGNHRCIVPDHIGCGFSEKPADRDYPYTLERRSDDLAAFLDHLGIKENITLVVHDWGGMIGLLYAVRNPEKIKNLVIFNTAAFHLPPQKNLPFLLKFVRFPLGAFMLRAFNTFALGAALTCVRRRRMSRDVRQWYLLPYNSWRNRLAILRFVQDIPIKEGDPAYSRVAEVEAGLPALRAKPALIIWGGRDFIFDHAYYRQFKAVWPEARYHLIEDAGHYVLEDAHEDIIPLMNRFLEESNDTSGSGP